MPAAFSAYTDGLRSFYHRVNNSAHKEPVTALNAPCLTWHRAFLIPRDRRLPKRSQLLLLTSDEKICRYRLNEIRDELDRIVVLVLRSFEARGHSVNVFPLSVDPIFLFRHFIHRNDLTCHFLPEETYEGEERTLIFSVAWEYEGLKCDVIVRLQLRTNLFSVTCFAIPKDENSSSRDSLKGLFPLIDQAIFSKLTNDFWLRFAAFVIRAGSLKGELGSSIFGSEFADVRGVILPCNGLNLNPSKPERGKEISDWAAEIVDQLRPVVTPNTYECSASYMLDRRALHLTALGPQPFDSHRQPRTPVTFLLCVHTIYADNRPAVGRRQLGRLLDRLLLAETLRLAALADLKLLRLASVDLSQIDSLQEKAHQQLALYEQEEIKASDTQFALEEFRRELDDITAFFLEHNEAGVGLNFRIESSRYYKSQYDESLKALRMTRVEGYQTYGQFIERRLGIEFEFIDRLGKRYQRALVERTAIDQSFSSIQTRNTGVVLAELQQVGELVLIAILVPYYIISSVSHVIEAAKPPLIEGRSKELTFVQIWIACVLLALVRSAYSRLSLKKHRRTRLIAVTILIILYAFCAHLTDVYLP